MYYRITNRGRRALDWLGFTTNLNGWRCVAPADRTIYIGTLGIYSDYPFSITTLECPHHAYLPLVQGDGTATTASE